MLLHLGKDAVVPLRDVIAIIDKKSAFESDETKRFFENANKDGRIEDTTEGDIKTYILTDKIRKTTDIDNNKRKSIIYTSNISSTTLKKRAGFIENIISIKLI